jgi:hypothetical protein
MTISGEVTRRDPAGLVTGHYVSSRYFVEVAGAVPQQDADMAGTRLLVSHRNIRNSILIQVANGYGNRIGAGALGTGRRTFEEARTEIRLCAPVSRDYGFRHGGDHS